MPAILTFLAVDGHSFKAGEFIDAFPEDHQFGYKEMPLNIQGEFNVTQINNQNINTLPIYSAIKARNAGTIEIGVNAPFDVVAGEVIVKLSGNRLLSYGVRDLVPDIRRQIYHIHIQDKTPEEVEVFTARYTQELTFDSLSYDTQTQVREVRIDNTSVSLSGHNGFTQQGVDDFVAEWNGTITDTDYERYVQMTAVLPPDVYTDFRESAHAIALSNYYAERRWYLSPDGVSLIEQNNGVFSGTAAQLNPYFKDRMLE